MRFERVQLLAGLGRVMPAAGKEQVKPVLGCVKISASNGVVELECTNQEQHIKFRFDAETGPGAFAALVNAARLAEILRRSNCETVECQLDGQTLTLIAGGGRFELPIQELSAFLEMPEASGTKAALKAVDLADAIASTIYATAKDVARFSMMGVCVSGKDGVLDFVATDGRRLAKAKAVAGMIGADIEPIVVPGIAWRMCQHLSGTVQLVVSKRDLVVRDESGFTLRTLLIDGKFPDYKAVIPKDKGKAWRGFMAQELAACVRQAQVMVDRESMRLEVEFGATGPGGAAILLGGKSASAGSSQITTYTDGDGTGVVNLNPNYLLEALDSLPDGEEVRFETRGNGPVTISAGNVYAMIMPQT